MNNKDRLEHDLEEHFLDRLYESGDCDPDGEPALPYLPVLCPEFGKGRLRLALLKEPSHVAATASFLSTWLPLFKRERAIRDIQLKSAAVVYLCRLKQKTRGNAWHESFQQILFHLFLLDEMPGLLFGDMRKWIDGVGDDEMPPEIREYVGTFLSSLEEAVRKRRHHPRGRHSLPDRNQVIKYAVDVVCAEFGLRPKRSPATRDKGHRESGCSIVWEPLAQLGIKIGEREVEDIYGRVSVRK
jgi:hypothetical protein